MTTDTRLNAIVAEHSRQAYQRFCDRYTWTDSVEPAIRDAVRAAGLDDQARRIVAEQRVGWLEDIIAQAAACFAACDLDPLEEPELWRAYELLSEALGEGKACSIRWRAIEAAAQALVDHLDDPYSGADDGRFDAERWETKRDELEAELRRALKAAPGTA